jgi:predicted GNAT superfamily acetyltransferase
MEFQPIQTMDSTLAEKWRDHIRLGFNHLLAANYIATDFLRAENRVFYVFTQDDGRYKFM